MTKKKPKPYSRSSHNSLSCCVAQTNKTLLKLHEQIFVLLLTTEYQQHKQSIPATKQKIQPKYIHEDKHS